MLQLVSTTYDMQCSSNIEQDETDDIRINGNLCLQKKILFSSGKQD